MGNRITITPEAKVKLAEAFEWYELKQAGLGHAPRIRRNGLKVLSPSLSTH